MLGLGINERKSGAWATDNVCGRVPVGTQAPEEIFFFPSRGLCPHRSLFRVAYEMRTMFAERCLWGHRHRKARKTKKPRLAAFPILSVVRYSSTISLLGLAASGTSCLK